MNMVNGLDDDIRKEETAEVILMPKKRPPFAYWHVGGTDYKMKLTTSVICQLEDKFKCNLINVMASSGGVPPISAMLTIAHGALKTWHSGIRYTDVQAMFDKYCEEGGTQITFMTDVLMPIYQVSGFFTEAQGESMSGKMEEVKELL